VLHEVHEGVGLMLGRVKGGLVALQGIDGAGQGRGGECKGGQK